MGQANTGFGGAILLSGSYSTVYNCTFVSNHAGLDGGAIIVRNAEGTTISTNNTIKRSVFKENSAARNGGAACWDNDCPNGTVINSTFKSNYAGDTAGALLSNVELYI